ncbi:hypothetical protein AQ813_23855 [Burkholderia pseudomallei]|nr:hypothetical protein AQ813_23855 [Burkholderia pseudomallei]
MGGPPRAELMARPPRPLQPRLRWRRAGRPVRRRGASRSAAARPADSAESCCVARGPPAWALPAGSRRGGARASRRGGFARHRLRAKRKAGARSAASRIAHATRRVRRSAAGA